MILKVLIIFSIDLIKVYKVWLKTKLICKLNKNRGSMQEHIFYWCYRDLTRKCKDTPTPSVFQEQRVLFQLLEKSKKNILVPLLLVKFNAKICCLPASAVLIFLLFYCRNLSFIRAVNICFVYVNLQACGEHEWLYVNFFFEVS